MRELELPTALPEEICAHVASFRVESYERLASCTRCARVLLFRGAGGMRQHAPYRVLQAKDGVFRPRCLSCAPWRAPCGAATCEVFAGDA